MTKYSGAAKDMRSDTDVNYLYSLQNSKTTTWLAGCYEYNVQKHHKYSLVLVGVRSTVVERGTYMRVYAGSSPTSADHRKELI